MNILFNRFPREFSTKRIFIQSKEEFAHYINKFNGRKACYSTIYPTVERRCYNGNNIDKVFFDLDNQETCWDSTKKIHNKLLELGFKHCVLFSGGGFHIYVFVEECLLEHPKSAIRGVQEYIARECDVNIGKPHESDIDEHIIGDIARISRIPNTYNIKRKRFCIYIIDEDFDKTFDEIKVIAKKQRFKAQLFGNKLFEISQFDEESENDISDIKQYDNDIDIENVDDVLKLLPPFMRKMLLSGMCGWYDRYIQILVSREIGLTESSANAIFKKYWDYNKYKHAIIEEGQIRYIYNRPNLLVPNWDTLQQKGYEITEEDIKYKFYKE